jgi:Icc-related predicted phosphoesterase
MKIHFMSDLHLESRGMPPVAVRGDVLVLAGDVSDGIASRTVDLTVHYRDAGLPILYVMGNHEYDENQIAQELRHVSRLCRGNGITLLHNRSVVIGGVRFAGTTLWTDFGFDGKPALSMALAQSTVSDYSLIRHGNAKLTPASTVRFHRKARAFLERVFAQQFAGPTVVVSHHAVSPQSIHARRAGDSLNPVYVTDLTAQIARWQPALMIHGHVHHRFDYRIGDTRVVTNPRGRVTVLEGFGGEVLERLEHDDFDPDLVIEI